MARLVTSTAFQKSANDVPSNDCGGSCCEQERGLTAFFRQAEFIR